MRHKSLSRFAISLFLILNCVRTSGSTLVINEVMFDPDGADYYDEFVELFNTGDSAVSVIGMQLSVNGVSSGLLVVDSSLGLVLKPGGFALIMEKDYLLNHKSSTYDEIIPDSTILAVISTSAFGTGGLKNTTPNLVALVSADSETLSIVTTTPNQYSGYSDERIEPDSSDVSENWGNSRQLFGTPGFRNSISPLPFDLFLSRFSCLTDSQSLETGKSIDFSIVVKNIGENSCDSALILFGEDHNGDSILSSQETLFSTSVELAPKDSIEISTSMTFNHSGIHQLIADVSFSRDDQPDNNRQTLEIRLPFQRHCLAINEFMYCPASGSGGEWIELLNISPDTINLRDWTISDNSTTVTLTKSSFFLPPDEFVVIASDSSFLRFWGSPPHFFKSAQSIPVLNNTSDSILINDLCGRRIDGLGYSKTWGYRTNFSLERKNPFMLSNSSSNWALSVSSEGGTPGQPNAILLKSLDLRWDNPDTFLKDDQLLPSEWLKIIFSIENNGLETVSQFQISFDFLSDTNMSIVPVSFYQQSFTDSIISLQKFLDSISVPIDFAGSGFIRGRISFADADSINNLIVLPVQIGYPAQSIIVNEFMCQPESGNTEWFELFNRSESSVNLRHWSVKHASTTIYEVTDSAIFIPPKIFAVVAFGDNTSFEIPPNVPVIIPGSFPALTNSADSIIIIDAAGQRIDALKYESAWGIRTGVSLERIDPDGKSSDRSNWKQSKDIRCATPGSPNSVLIREFDAALDSVFIPKNEHPVVVGKPVQISVAVRNSGLQATNSMNLEIRIFNEFSILDTIIPISQVLTPGENRTEFLTFQPEKGGVFSLLAVVLLESDGDSSNDSATCSLPIGYPLNCIAVNEIMYSPNSGETEWFELVNRLAFPIDLNRWRFRDGSGKWSPLCDSSQTIEPSKFFVVAATSDFRSDNPEFTGTVVFPSLFPNLNNTSDSLFLQDAADHLIETVHYQSLWGGSEGKSIERRNPDKPAITSDNWGTSVSETGSTPGTANSILKRDHDLAIISFTPADSILEPSERAAFSLRVKNIGKLPSTSFSLEIYSDVNSDSLWVNDEQIWCLPAIQAPEPDSTALFFGEISDFRSGKNSLIARVVLDSDNFIENNIAYSTLRISFPKQSLVINEFLPYPNSEQVEFIEIINLTCDSIDLAEWTLSNLHFQTNLISARIPPGGYSILSADSSFFTLFAPSSAGIVIPEKWPGMNNVADAIILKDLAGKTIDSVFFDENWKPKQGISFEKLLPVLPGSLSDSWRFSTSQTGETAGFLNSITPYDQDLAIDSIATFDNIGDTLTVFSTDFIIHNTGKFNSSSANLIIEERICQQFTEILRMTIPSLTAGENRQIFCSFGSFNSGIHHLQAIVQLSGDEHPVNDTIRFDVIVAFPPASLLISEFLAFPTDALTAGLSIAEYAEFYNPTSKNVSLEGWTFSDENTGRPVSIGKTDSIRALDYFVVANDSSIFHFPNISPEKISIIGNFPSLNNDEDRIFIFDPSMMPIDSVWFTSLWKIEQNIAMERVFFTNPNNYQNWRSSVSLSGGTPGQKNSVSINTEIAKPGIRVEPNPFSPDGDSQDDEAVFHYRLPFPSSKISLEIFDVAGRLIYKPADHLSTSSEGVIYWNGESKYGSKARTGIYIVKCTAIDSGGKKTVGYVTTVALVRGL